MASAADAPLSTRGTPLLAHAARHQAFIGKSVGILRARGDDSGDIMRWVQQHRYINGERWSYESGGPRMDLGAHDVRGDVLRRPFLAQLVRDSTPERAIIKPRQSEQTENQINENLYYAVVHGAKISHVFPTDELGDAISNEKIRPAIDESPEIKSALMGQGAVRRYAFRSGGLITVSGALKRAGGRASSRDILVFDEWDFIPSGISAVYEELLSHSRFHLIRRISTPTVPGVGIDLEVKAGCEYEWWWTCPACGKPQTFSWPDNLIGFFDSMDTSPDDPAYQARLHEVFIGCRYCHRPLDRNSREYAAGGQWIAKRPELRGERASYYLNAMMIPWKTGKELLRGYHKLGGYVWQWWNEKFGLAYLKADNRLTDEEILGCVAEYQVAGQRSPAMANVAIGVDWGEKQSWVVVSCNGMDPRQTSRRCIVWIEEINEVTLRANGIDPGRAGAHTQRVIQLAERFNADIIVNDANGIGIDRNKAIIDRFQSRAWGCFFDTAEAGRQLRQSKLQIPQWTKDSHRVQISKVYTVKAIQQEFRTRTLSLPAMTPEAAENVQKFTRHNRSLAIQPRWDAEYEREYEIAVKVSAEDHLFDAHMYSKIGWDHLTDGNQVPAVYIFGAH